MCKENVTNKKEKNKKNVEIKESEKHRVSNSGLLSRKSRERSRKSSRKIGVAKVE